jgi:hypothetical protein
LEVLRKKAESLCPRLEWDTISVVIEYLDRPDPDGMSFRYPYGKDGSDLLSAIGGDLVGMEGKFRAAAEWLHPFACELPRPGGYRVFERK